MKPAIIIDLSEWAGKENTFTVIKFSVHNCENCTNLSFTIFGVKVLLGLSRNV